MSHWATELIGKPWEYGAQGPDAFDCWGFTRFVQRTQYGVEMPAVQVPEDWREAREVLETHEERNRWNPVAVPGDGDVVLMARNRIPLHIGVVVKANGVDGVLHCFDPAGVVFQTQQGLRAAGWGRLTYYRRQQG